jgi:hypothetical protein
VRESLKREELAFLDVQKSAQTIDSKGPKNAQEHGIAEVVCKFTERNELTQKLEFRIGKMLWIARKLGAGQVLAQLRNFVAFPVVLDSLSLNWVVRFLKRRLESGEMWMR